jgi:Circularly permutated YpsA SLOG family
MSTKENLPTPLSKIISGGQTGADMGALIAARTLGLETGGFAPEGWQTEDGPQEPRLRGFGLIECEEPGYPPRTTKNVANSDGTLLVGDHQIGGSRLTLQLAAKLKKPLFLLAFEIHSEASSKDRRIVEFRSWLRDDHINILNVAGNRESEAPGIHEFTRQFLLDALG